MRYCVLLVGVIVFVLSLSAQADRLVLKDGRVLEGRVVKETRTSVEFEALISNISTVMTFSKRDIESIEKGEVPEKLTKKKAKSPSRERTTRTPVQRTREPVKQGAVRYLEIPIEGQFGVEIAPEGVRDTLDYAKKRGIEHVVFRLKSPGGFVWAAQEIAEVMEDEHEGLTYYAVIEQAISASIWVVFGCDEIFVLTSGRVGAAVVFTQDRTTGDAEVDAKMNSAIAGTLAARAIANGHSPEIVRAMVLQESSVYAVPNDDDGYVLTDQQPSVEHDVLDTRETVLTLTSEEAVRYGVARALADDEALGDVLGYAGWTRFSEYGSAAMRKAAESLEKDKSKLDKMLAAMKPLIRAVNRNHDEAQEKDPRNGSYMYYEDTGAFTTQSMKEWRDRTNRSIGAYRRAIDGSVQLRVLKQKCERYGIDFNTYFATSQGEWSYDLIEFEARCQREIQWLEENVNRNSY
jgi:hypothetical protein